MPQRNIWLRLQDRAEQEKSHLARHGRLARLADNPGEIVIFYAKTIEWLTRKLSRQQEILTALQAEQQDSHARQQALQAGLDGLGLRLDRTAAALGEQLDRTAAQQASLADRALFLNGQIAARQLRGADRMSQLSDAEFRVFSQWGEDGIIEWLVSRLPEIPRSFVEFGVESYTEANTRFLMRHRGWRGLVMDGSQDNMTALQQDGAFWMHDLQAVASFVTAENINDLIRDHGFAGELGILSIDVDGVDYWIHEAIDCVNPAILIMEYNAVLGDLHPITVPYRPDFERSAAHHSCLYFGASLPALCRSAEARGYVLAGTNSNGVNAFFLRADLAPGVLEALDRPGASWPQRHREARGPDGALTLTRGTDKAALIADMPVYHIDRQEVLPLSALGPLYSDAWLAQM